MSADDSVTKETFNMGEHIFMEGDQDLHFYIVESGQIKIYTNNESGGQVPIITISEGESFGEFALLDKQPRSASAVALTDCVLIKVSQQGYEQLLSELPVWASSMLKSFAGRLKNMNVILKKMPQFIGRD